MWFIRSTNLNIFLCFFLFSHLDLIVLSLVVYRVEDMVIKKFLVIPVIPLVEEFPFKESHGFM